MLLFPVNRCPGGFIPPDPHVWNGQQLHEVSNDFIPTSVTLKSRERSLSVSQVVSKHQHLFGLSVSILQRFHLHQEPLFAVFQNFIVSIKLL